jgi:hypothetical protein
MGPRKDSQRHVVWRERLLRFRDAGLSIAEFCRREQVSEPSFYLWRKRLQGSHANRLSAPRGSRQGVPRNDSRGSFVELALPLSPPAGRVEIELPSGAIVRLPDGRPDVLLAAIQAAGQLPATHHAKEGFSC